MWDALHPLTNLAPNPSQAPFTFERDLHVIVALSKNSHTRFSVLDGNESNGHLPSARVNYFEAVLKQRYHLKGNILTNRTRKL